MKKIALITVGVLLIAGVIVAVSLHTQVAPDDVDFGNSSVTFPNVGSGGVNTATSTGANSFLGNPEVHADPYNAGYYYVGYQPSTQPENDDIPYSIRYIAETHYFNIVLLQEPIGENRRNAETYLMTLLGLTREQMCSLEYAVYVPDYVNGTFSSVNLGFSFCPGAVKLPQ